jgi:hypothetical protein
MRAQKLILVTFCVCSAVIMGCARERQATPPIAARSTVTSDATTSDAGEPDRFYRYLDGVARSGPSVPFVGERPADETGPSVRYIGWTSGAAALPATPAADSGSSNPPEASAPHHERLTPEAMARAVVRSAVTAEASR